MEIQHILNFIKREITKVGYVINTFILMLIILVVIHFRMYCTLAWLKTHRPSMGFRETRLLISAGCPCKWPLYSERR